MKQACLLLFFIFAISSTSLPQTAKKYNRTNEFLKWLIKKDHIAYLNIKSNSSAFYDTTALKKQSIINASFQIIPNACLNDLLSSDEAKIFKTAPRILMQTDWTKKHSTLNVKFVTERFVMSKEIKNVPFIVYSFSEPLFLNESLTRVIIGESFTCGMACGRMDLLLCEFKNGKWQLIARAVIENE